VTESATVWSSTPATATLGDLSIGSHEKAEAATALAKLCPADIQNTEEHVTEEYAPPVVINFLEADKLAFQRAAQVPRVPAQLITPLP
jgi:hypothetical protein